MIICIVFISAMARVFDKRFSIHSIEHTLLYQWFSTVMSRITAMSKKVVRLYHVLVQNKDVPGRMGR